MKEDVVKMSVRKYMAVLYLMLQEIACRTFGHLRAKRIFGYCGKGSYLMKPLRVGGGNSVYIGENVTILPQLRMEAWKKDARQKEPCIRIGDGCNIEQNVHITAAQHVYIGKDVSVLGGSVITDIIHPYEKCTQPPAQQEICVKPVDIGDQTFIGMHAMVMPGVTIGKHCVIGANAVVTENIPDYSVAAGVPAKVIKRYDEKKACWVRTGAGRNERKNSH